MKATGEQLEQTRRLLDTIRYATMATVNPDGSPHNSPYVFLYDNRLSKLYWGSHPDSQHSQNILRTGQLFVVLYDMAAGGGLYISGGNGHLAEGGELDVALRVHNQFRARYGKEALPRAYYEGDSPQRMWAANITGLWINGVERDDDGRVAKDYRIPVTAAELLP